MHEEEKNRVAVRLDFWTQIASLPTTILAADVGTLESNRYFAFRDSNSDSLHLIR